MIVLAIAWALLAIFRIAALVSAANRWLASARQEWRFKRQGW